MKRIVFLLFVVLAYSCNDTSEDLNETEYVSLEDFAAVQDMEGRQGSGKKQPKFRKELKKSSKRIKDFLKSSSKRKLDNHVTGILNYDMSSEYLYEDSTGFIVIPVEIQGTGQGTSIVSIFDSGETPNFSSMKVMSTIEDANVERYTGEISIFHESGALNSVGKLY